MGALGPKAVALEGGPEAGRAIPSSPKGVRLADGAVGGRPQQALGPGWTCLQLQVRAGCARIAP